MQQSHAMQQMTIRQSLLANSPLPACVALGVLSSCSPAFSPLYCYSGQSAASECQEQAKCTEATCQQALVAYKMQLIADMDHYCDAIWPPAVRILMVRLVQCSTNCMFGACIAYTCAQHYFVVS